MSGTESTHGAGSLAHFPVSLVSSVMGLTGLAIAWQKAHRAFAVPAGVWMAVAALASAVFVFLIALLRDQAVALSRGRARRVAASGARQFFPDHLDQPDAAGDRLGRYRAFSRVSCSGRAGRCCNWFSPWRS
jgi:hypothetical protein